MDNWGTNNRGTDNRGTDNRGTDNWGWTVHVLMRKHRREGYQAWTTPDGIKHSHREMYMYACLQVHVTKVTLIVCLSLSTCNKSDINILEITENRPLLD